MSDKKEKALEELDALMDEVNTLRKEEDKEIMKPEDKGLPPDEEVNTNSLSELMKMVEEEIKNMKKEEEVSIPKGHIDVNQIVEGLEAFLKELQGYMRASGRLAEMKDVAEAFDIEAFSEQISKLWTSAGELYSLFNLNNEFDKTRALERMNFVQEFFQIIIQAINERTYELVDGEISVESELLVQRIDELANQNLDFAIAELFQLQTEFFSAKSNQIEWERELIKHKGSYKESTSFDNGFSEQKFALAQFDDWLLTDEHISSKSDLPHAKTFLESMFLVGMDHIRHQLQLMFFYQSISKPYDLETFLSPLPEIENFNQFADMLVAKADRLTTVPFDISEEESNDINDQLSKLISIQKTYLEMLERLELGVGRYKPDLADVNSHMIVYKQSPRTAYDTLPMWPMKRKERYESMSQLDIYNWLGLEYHSEDLIYDEKHNIVYRDFLNYIQHIGFEHKKVTAYDSGNEGFRIQPKLSSFTWRGQKNKYRSNASIFFYCQDCPYSNHEMRISVDTSKTPYSESLTVNVGLDMFKEDLEGMEIPNQERILHLRELAENYCVELFKNFEAYQKEFGLLKNSKFNAFFQELELKGRTFDDLILSEEKKDLIDDNIFAILRNSEVLMERGVEINRGIMLAGPPGVGKSLTIDAIVADGKCTILFADFLMLHQAMDKIFQVARKYAPTILIMEDIDALGITSQRAGGGSGAGLSTLLNHMDGIKSNNGVITIATSNHPESLDWALIARPGRFDVRIDYPYPDHKILKGIFELKLNPYPHNKNIDIDKIVNRMPIGFTGSHIQDIVNQANYISINQMKDASPDIEINQKALEIAFERALYNFNKFLLERPHVKLKQDIDASEVLQMDSNPKGENSFFM